MLLHWIFVWSGLIQIQNIFEIPWKTRKKKKKTFSISFLVFGPSAQLPPAFSPASCCLSRSAFPGRWPERVAALLHFLAPFPWAEPIVGPASARTHVRPLRR
jgi:hypothetical protein